MNKKILCPFCGAEMEAKAAHHGIPRRWNAWTSCTRDDCGAEGPIVSEMEVESKQEAMEAARAAALRRYTPPIKPMTLEEATSTDEAVWYEYNGSTRTEKIDCVALPEVKAYTEICTLRRDSAWLVTTECYGKTWRCWSRKPTDEERSAAEWQK